jgi:excinuclease UvrABC nuclease subunit
MITLPPEQIDLMTLPSMPIDRCRELPACAAVYFVLDADGQVLYIGQTGELRTRWTAHHRRKAYAAAPGARLVWLTISDKDLLLSVEAACIAFFQPRDNGKTIPRGSGDMRQVTIRFTDDQRDWLEVRAKNEKRSLADYCRWFLLLDMPDRYSPPKTRRAGRMGRAESPKP